LAGLLQPRRGGGQAEAEAVHRPGVATVAARQRTAQRQPAAPALDPQGNADRRQTGVVLGQGGVDGVCCGGGGRDRPIG
ncbi:MAG: hypothetical protein ACRC1L_08020, partial [Prochlorococcaceae cyanobacterium]